MCLPCMLRRSVKGKNIRVNVNIVSMFYLALPMKRTVQTTSGISGSRFFLSAFGLFICCCVNDEKRQNKTKQHRQK